MKQKKILKNGTCFVIPRYSRIFHNYFKKKSSKWKMTILELYSSFRAVDPWDPVERSRKGFYGMRFFL
jgi:hypothetical protein